MTAFLSLNGRIIVVMGCDMRSDACVWHVQRRGLSQYRLALGIDHCCLKACMSETCSDYSGPSVETDVMASQELRSREHI
jgi:hypothetical protein